MKFDLNNIRLSVRDDQYVAVIEEKAYIINMCFYNILSALKKGKDLEWALLYLKEKEKYGDSEITNIKDKFLQFIDFVSKCKKENKEYIKLKKILINEYQTKKICSCFKFLFKKNIFLILFITTLFVNICFTVWVGLDNNVYDSFSIRKIIIVILLSNIFILFHEFGHSSACISFGVPVKDIGFGLYFIFPVLYSNVTGSWLLSKRKRITINIAGIYFQLLINLFLIIAYTITERTSLQNIFLYLFTSNTIVCIYSIIPFFRNDGYWVYCDYFEITNLITKSKNWYDKKLTKDNLPVVGYGFCNFLFHIYILLMLVRFVIYNFINLIDGKTFMYLIKYSMGTCICIYGIYKIIKTFKKCSKRYANEDI